MRLFRVAKRLAPAQPSEQFSTLHSAKANLKSRQQATPFGMLRVRAMLYKGTDWNSPTRQSTNKYIYDTTPADNRIYDTTPPQSTKERACDTTPPDIPPRTGFMIQPRWYTIQSTNKQYQRIYNAQKRQKTAKKQQCITCAGFNAVKKPSIMLNASSTYMFSALHQQLVEGASLTPGMPTSSTLQY